MSMKKTLLLTSVFALSLAVTQQAQAGSTTGSNGGYYYGIYTEGSGTKTLTFPSAGGIKCVWSSGFNDIGWGKGWKPGSVRTTKYKIDSASSVVHSIGLYGWTTSPLIEYYIDSIGSPGGTSIGTVTTDGFTYNSFKQQRVNAPSIQGTCTFWQLKDGRKYTQAAAGQTVTHTMANHVNHWKSAGGVGFGSSVYDLLVEQESFSGPGTAQLTIQ
jgi:endo-1,4-beta-xylanase